MQPRLRQHYEAQVIPKLAETFGFGNPMQVPRIEKVVINVGLGDAKDDPKLLESVVKEVARISGQRPVVTRARKSVSNFNLRDGMPIRDFRGFNGRAFDGRGNYSVGIREQMIFPEIDYDEIVRVHGMDVTFVTTTDRDDEALVLLREMGFPFREETPVVV